MNYLKKLHMICLSQDEFEKIYKNARRHELFSAILEKGYSLGELGDDQFKVEDVVNSILPKIFSKKEEIEIFVALFEQLRMYPDGRQVCFPLKKSTDPRKLSISSLEDLKNAVEENTITDFGIICDDGLRLFQLKQYKGQLNTSDLLVFIERVINKYGRNFGDTNLLIVLQSENGDVGDVNWKEINERIACAGIKSDAEVLISFNENNMYDVIIQVYPKLGTLRKKRPTEFEWYGECV